MDKLRTGLVGCGKVGHLIAAALVKLPESDFVTVNDHSPERSKEFAAKYGVKHYADIEDMVAGEKLDIVVVGTPHPAHKGPAVTALQAGANVLVEKPMASSVQDCDEMINAASQSGRKLGVISQRRLYKPSLRVKEAIDSGKIGKPILGTITMLGWRDRHYYEADPWRGTWADEGGGVLVNQSPHQLDLLQWFMGGEIDELYGNWSNLNHPYIEVEDTALAILKFKNGGIGNILVSNSQKPGFYCNVHIHGENGASVGVQTDGGAMFVAGMTTIQEPPVLDLWSVSGEEAKMEQWNREDSERFLSHDDIMSQYHLEQIRDFIEAVTGDRDPMISGTEGRKTVEIFTAIYRSTRDRALVKWPILPESKGDYDGRLPAK